MRNKFKEYYQFSDTEFKELWRGCLFVFDTSTLLNMYRYSRQTVQAYFKILTELKAKNQLWLPYQVGYEFHERRITVITDYEKSYDEILKILEQAKNDIQTKYKEHPFLDLKQIKEGINAGLKTVESKIKKQKRKHPKWLEEDEVLENLNTLFEDNIGSGYDSKKISEIKEQGKKRYESKIPPGFKDDSKSDDKKYGDLIIWYQIIDKARETKKPIIFISGDVKEDWWLEKDGKRIMPLPHLKKEMLDKAQVDFHIYTADRFLELYHEYNNKKDVDQKTIKEVKKVRESEEARMRMQIELIHSEREYNPRLIDQGFHEFINFYELIEELLIYLQQVDLRPSQRSELDNLAHNLRELGHKLSHGDIDRIKMHKFYHCSREILFVLDKIIHSNNFDTGLIRYLRKSIDRLENMHDRIRRYM